MFHQFTQQCFQNKFSFEDFTTWIALNVLPLYTGYVNSTDPFIIPQASMKLLITTANHTNLDNIKKQRHCQQRSVWSRLWFFQWSCIDVRVELWRKLSTEKLMLLNYGVGEDSWECLGLQGDPTSPSWRRSVLGVHWKDWGWSWNSNTLATSWEELTRWKRPWCWEELGTGGEGDDRGWDG